MKTLDTIQKRKSPETFLSTPISTNDIQTIVEAGLYAPIFGKIHFTVINDKEMINKINIVTLEMMKNSGNEFAKTMANQPGYNAIRNAPTVVVLSALGGNDENGFNMANVSCAAQNMLLAATELGIGSRFAMGPIMAFSQESILQMLHLPDGYTPLVMVLLGNIDDSFDKRHKEANNISYIDAQL